MILTILLTSWTISSSSGLAPETSDVPVLGLVLSNPVSSFIRTRWVSLSVKSLISKELSINSIRSWDSSS